MTNPITSQEVTPLQDTPTHSLDPILGCQRGATALGEIAEWSEACRKGGVRLAREPMGRSMATHAGLL
jgi:hypothetical protein